MRSGRVVVERLTANAKVAKMSSGSGLSPSILRHSGILGAAEKNEAVLNISTTKILAKKIAKEKY